MVSCWVFCFSFDFYSPSSSCRRLISSSLVLVRSIAFSFPPAVLDGSPPQQMEYRGSKSCFGNEHQEPCCNGITLGISIGPGISGGELRRHRATDSAGCSFTVEGASRTWVHLPSRGFLADNTLELVIKSCSFHYKHSSSTKKEKENRHSHQALKLTNPPKNEKHQKASSSFGCYRTILCVCFFTRSGGSTPYLFFLSLSLSAIS